MARLKLDRETRQAFCGPAKRWTRGRTLAEAWRACKNGHWMAWWLWHSSDVPFPELRIIFNQAQVAVDDTSDAGTFDAFSFLDATQFAKLIRAAFTAQGHRRKLRQVA